MRKQNAFDGNAVIAAAGPNIEVNTTQYNKPTIALK